MYVVQIMPFKILKLKNAILKYIYYLKNVIICGNLWLFKVKRGYWIYTKIATLTSHCFEHLISTLSFVSALKGLHCGKNAKQKGNKMRS